MIIEKIKHDCWVYKNIDGIEHRGKYITHGYSYAEFYIEKQSFVEKQTWLGFGKPKQIPIWSSVGKIERKVIERSEYYSVEETEKIFNSFVVEPIIVQKCYMYAKMLYLAILPFHQLDQ